MLVQLWLSFGDGSAWCGLISYVSDLISVGSAVVWGGDVVQFSLGAFWVQLYLACASLVQLWFSFG